jgi:Tol biopolymer transport system component
MRRPGLRPRARGFSRVIAGLGTLAAALGIAVPAQATFPGGNGRIAYTWSRGAESFDTPQHPRLVGVVSVRADGSGRRLIARRGSHPGYSPDGRRIAFVRARHLWVARADGRHARRVTPRGFLVEDYEWSPRGNRLAVAREFTDRSAGWLYTVERDGSGLRRLARAPWGIRLFPGAWSPDAKAIVYEQSRGSARPFVMIARAGRIVRHRVGVWPSWSRLGLIAYETRLIGKRFRVCVTRAHATANLRCFGYPDAAVRTPIWFPAGRRLMFSYTLRGSSEELWTARPAGTILTRTPLRDMNVPTPSPDGRLLAFESFRLSGDRRFEYHDLYVARPDGTGRRLLVRGGWARTPDWQARAS